MSGIPLPPSLLKWNPLLRGTPPVSPTIVEQCPPTIVEKCPPHCGLPFTSFSVGFLCVLLLPRVSTDAPTLAGSLTHTCTSVGQEKGFCSHTTHHHLCPWDLANFWFLPPFKVQRSPTLGKTGKRRSVLKPNLCEISSQAQKRKWQGVGGEETKKFNGTLFKRRPLRIL